ncbi:MAG: MGMT family protein [Nanoarchaeota archaeon]
MNFSNRCYELLKTIPRGKVTTYKDIALKLGTKAYRAVGNAMNKNPHDTNVYPCHRVISSSGEVGGYAHGIEAKIKRLKSEGIEIMNNRIDLEKFRFTFPTKS